LRRFFLAFHSVTVQPPLRPLSILGGRQFFARYPVTNRFIAAVLVIVGLINFLPVLGVIGPERLRLLYGIPFDEPNLVMLMRHRAVMLGLVGGFIVTAGFLPALRTPAFIAGFISMLSFVVLAWMQKTGTAEINRVAWIDLAASVALAVAAGCHFFFSGTTR
jgi:hypothetical protein